MSTLLPSLEKNQIYETTIVDLSHLGSGVAKLNDMIVFVEQAIPGDVVKLKIVKVKKTYAYGKLLELITPSPDRETPICPVFATCGGCSLMHMRYEAQVRYKHQQFLTLLAKQNLDISKVTPTVKTGSPYHFRNKAIFPVAQRTTQTPDKRTPVIGFYKRGSHESVDYTACHITTVAEGEFCIICGCKLVQRDDDKEDVVRKRIEVYKQNTAPLIDYYRGKGVLHAIDGDRPVDDVCAEVKAIVQDN